MTPHPHYLYMALGIDQNTYMSRERDAMRRKHAVRKVLYSLDYTLKEIAAFEDLTYVKEKPTCHSTIANSIHQPFDRITETYVQKCQAFVSNQ